MVYSILRSFRSFMNILLIVLYKSFCKLYFLSPVLRRKKKEIVLDKWAKRSIITELDGV